MNSIKKHINLLGLKARDKITGFEGIITSIAFDLFGCIQVILNPGIGKEGELKDSCWFDINRLEILVKKPVMKIPDFLEEESEETKKVNKVANGDKGPEIKPLQ